MAEKINRVATPASQDQIISAIVSAWKRVFGIKPTLNQVGKTWAQIAVETGSGKYIFNNNVGNINWTPNYPGDYYETKDSTTLGNNPANRQYYIARMRAYENLFDGIVDYLNLLKNRPQVMKSLQKGTPKDFSSALASVHYYDPHVRDDYVNKEGKKVSGYTTGLSSHYNQFMQQHHGGMRVSPSQHESGGMLANFFKGLSNLLDSFASTETIMMKNKYGSSYPANKYLISIDSDSDFSSKLEFARILSIALKEEIDSNSEIYTDGADVEVQCALNANKDSGLEVVKEFCAAFSNVFEYSTKSIGGIKVYTFIMPDKDPCYQRLDIKLADINYRKFQLKFIKKA